MSSTSGRGRRTQRAPQTNDGAVGQTPKEVVGGAADSDVAGSSASRHLPCKQEWLLLRDIQDAGDDADDDEDDDADEDVPV